MQLVRFHTFTYLSQPADTMIGFWLFGENLGREAVSTVGEAGRGCRRSWLPDAGDPVLVTVLLDGVLALGQGVPQLQGGGHHRSATWKFKKVGI